MAGIRLRCRSRCGPAWGRQRPEGAERRRGPCRLGTAATRAERSSSSRASPSARRADGVRVGAPALAALEGADRLGGEAGPLGELLLGQRPRLAQAAQHDGEVARRRTRIHGADARRRIRAREGFARGAQVWCRCGPAVGGVAPAAPRRWDVTASGRPDERNDHDRHSNDQHRTRHPRDGADGDVRPADVGRARSPRSRCRWCTPSTRGWRASRTRPSPSTPRSRGASTPWRSAWRRWPGGPGGAPRSRCSRTW